MPEAVRRGARITTPAPFDLFVSYRKAEPTPLNWLKAARAAMVWRAHAGLGSLAIAGRLLGWFFRFPPDLLRFMWRYSAIWKRHFHRTRPQQFLDLVAAAAGNGLMPRDYYRCDIATKKRKASFFDVIPYQLYATPLEALSHQPGSREDLERTRDKAAFYAFCAGKGLPVPTVYGLIRCSTDSAETGLLPPGDFLVKPARGGQGKGIAIWRHELETGKWSSRGRTYAAGSLLRHLGKQAAATPGGFVLQEVLENGQEIRPFAPFALSTFRIVTMLDESSEPTVVVGQFRTATMADSPVDNFHAGGCLFHIDLATGLFGKGERGDYSENPKTIEQHPATGNQISGVPVPRLDEILSLALRAHRVVPALTCIGWDVAVTTRGPVLIEANVPPGLQPTQQVQVGGFVRTRFMRLLAHQCRRWIEENEPAGSRFRVGADRTDW
ncbi:MAG: hypothetical protein KKB66_14855 [Alphaproteobacteria bacterium]|nr:hypothetical protein [Alphaproteobacteria bacterium]MBU0805691.1 hypothetical protein [Alphaproteobacteria bacterium]MBU0873637.1 hypothetical protein [Alphaproteobacteria bacterium]MBU1401135.1 hypothetical protein [Alphaproteobacteria bacterium]MBU1592448.1 hypothetical protein [Alphaproteobacteria bacterium]